MKKTLAILLSLALVICMIPATAFAGTEGESASGVTFDLSKSTAVYSGAVQKPTVNNVKYNGTEVKAENYKVEYGTGTYKDAGTYTVKVTVTVPGSGEGEAAATYEGTASYEITALDISTLSIIVPDQEAGASAVVGEKIVFNGYQTSEFEGHYDKVRNGTEVTFTGKSGKNLTGSKTVTFKTVPSLATVFDAKVYEAGAYDGTEKTVSVYLTKKSSYTGTAYINSTDYDVYPKTVIAKQPYTITITAKEGSGYAGSITLTNQDIVAARNASSVTVDAIPNQAYTGGQLRPAVRVTDFIGGKTVELKAGTDFYVTYGNNVAVGNSNGSAILTFMGNYTGTKTVYFNIIDPAKDLSSAYVTVSNVAPKTYTGYIDEPGYTVSLGASTLSRYNEYEVVYTNIATGVETKSPVDAGTYMITIRGIGAYGGEQVLVAQHIINPRNVADVIVSGVSPSYVYAGAKIEPSVSAYYPANKLLNKGTTFGTGDYYVTYGANNITGTSAGVVYIHGTGNFTGVKSVRFNIEGKSIAGCSAYFTNGVSNSVYTGAIVRPSITVKDGLYTTLTQGIDYTVSYKNSAGEAVSSMKDTGHYSVVITGKGNYSGTINLSYTITGKDISGYTVTLSKTSATATGSAQNVSVTSVKSGTTTLTTANYDVSYLDANGTAVKSMTAPGMYTVVVTGKGAYSGSAYATFIIEGVPQTVSVNKTSYKVYTTTDDFKITAKATGDGTGFVYESSDPTVASVSATGVVTVYKLGRAKITVTTVGMKKSAEASKDVEIKVYPAKAKITRKPWTEGKKGSFRVRWNVQEDTTTYQIRYSTTSDFKTYKTKTVTASEKYATQSTRISGLKSGTKYYVKVRAVKTVTDDAGKEVKYYGTWANWRSVVTK